MAIGTLKTLKVLWALEIQAAVIHGMGSACLEIV